MNIAGFNLLQVGMKDFCHGGTRNIGPFFGQTTFGKVSPGVFRLRHIDIGDNIHNATVRFFRQTFILAAVTSFHMKNRDM